MHQVTQTKTSLCEMIMKDTRVYKYIYIYIYCKTRGKNSDIQKVPQVLCTFQQNPPQLQSRVFPPPLCTRHKQNELTNRVVLYVNCCSQCYLRAYVTLS